MDKFACEFILVKCEGENNCEDSDLISSIFDLNGMADIETDILPFLLEQDDFKALSDGDYLIFVCGTVEWESSVSWETGVDDGEWVFNWEDEDVFITKAN